MADLWKYGPWADMVLPPVADTSLHTAIDALEAVVRTMVVHDGTTVIPGTIPYTYQELREAARRLKRLTSDVQVARFDATDITDPMDIDINAELDEDGMKTRYIPGYGRIIEH